MKNYGQFLAIGLAVAMTVTSVLPINISAASVGTKEADNTSTDQTGITFSYSSDTNPIGTLGTDGKPLYGGDPSILVDGDTVYLYVGHDVSPIEAYNIPEYCCYSTKDLKNWEYHGVVLSMKDVTWGTADAAWAGQVMKYNGNYYMYYCSFDKTDSGRASIGVAVSDSPTGPFVDKGTPLVKGSKTNVQTANHDDIDPTAWIETDTDGVEHRYLAWGNTRFFVCELNEDMVSVKDINEDGKITYGLQSSGKTSKDVDIIDKNVAGLTVDGHTYTEAPWLYRRQDADGNYIGDYYLFYACGWREQMAYATTDDLLDGNLEHGSIVMPPSATSNTNHMAVFDFKGKTYFVYHNGSLPGGSGFRRTPCITEIKFNDDGSITEIPETAAGINGTVSKIYTGNGDLVSHEKFVNSVSDTAYPYTKVGVGVYAGADAKDSEWVITQGKADRTNADYVSIQSENKPGLYLTANEDKSVTLAQDYNINAFDETAKKQTFKKVAGLADANGVSYESVSQPGYYLTMLGTQMYLMQGKDTAATFYIDNKPDVPLSSGPLSNDNELTGITASSTDGALDVTKDDAGCYNIKVPYTVSSVKTVVSMKDTKGFAFVGNVLADADGSVDITLYGAKTELDITVYAEDAVTKKTCKLTIERDYTDFKLGGNILKAFNFEGQDDGAVAVQKATGTVALENKTGVTFKYSNGRNNGKAMTLNGTYGLKLLDDASVLGESYTISYWMKPKKIGGGFDPTLTAGTFNPQYWINLNFAANIWSYNGGYVDTTTTGSYKANEWQNVVLVVDGSKAGTAANTVNGKLFINGILVCEGNVAKDVMKQANSKVYFGANAWDAYYEGDIDEILMLDAALTPSDVQAIAAGIVEPNVTDKSGSDKVEPVVTDKPGSDIVEPAVTDKSGSISLNKKQPITLYTGKASNQTTVKATVTGSSKTVSWKSSKTKVATVNKTGETVTIKAVGKGTATITATVDGKNASIKVTVKNPTITVKNGKKAVKSKLTVNKKKTTKLTITTSPKNAGISLAKLSKKAKKVLRASIKGGKLTIRGKKKGSAVLSIKSGKATKKITVKIK